MLLKFLRGLQNYLSLILRIKIENVTQVKRSVIGCLMVNNGRVPGQALLLLTTALYSWLEHRLASAPSRHRGERRAATGIRCICIRVCVVGVRIRLRH